MKKILLILLSVSLIISQTSCNEKESLPITDTVYDLLDTTCTISIYDMDETDASDIISGAFNLCREYELMFSKSVEFSDIYRVNHSGTVPIDISKDTGALIQLSQHYFLLSGGKFDITVGKLTDLWDFKSGNAIVPDSKKIDYALSTVGMGNITITPNSDIESDGFILTKSNSRTALDVGGIAKGYIADRVAEYIEARGSHRAIINLGGNIVAIGSKSDSDKWSIGIEKPFSDRRDIIGSVKVEDKTVVTSGIYERMFMLDGKLYHHILDVDTGFPVESDVELVTLVADKGHSADCDALSTICLLLDTEKAMEIINAQEGIEALFLSKSGKLSLSDGMAEMFSEV